MHLYFGHLDFSQSDLSKYRTTSSVFAALKSSSFPSRILDTFERLKFKLEVGQMGQKCPNFRHKKKKGFKILIRIEQLKFRISDVVDFGASLYVFQILDTHCAVKYGLA